MKTYIVTLASGRKIEITPPVTYYDMSTRVYENIYAKWDGELTPAGVVKLLSIMTGEEYKDYIHSTDKNMENVLLKTIDCVVRPTVILDALPVPSFFKIDGHTVILPTSLKNLTLGQNLYVKRCADNKDIRSGIALAAAIYLQPVLDNSEFKDERAEYWADRLRDLPVTDIYPIGFFTYRRANFFGNGQTLYSHLIQRIMESTIHAVVLLRRLRKLIYSPHSVSYQ